MREKAKGYIEDAIWCIECYEGKHDTNIIDKPTMLKSAKENLRDALDFVEPKESLT